MADALRHHWPEYLIDAAGLGLFMVSAFTFGALLEHPASPVHQAISDSLARRFLMGLAMGSTAVGIIYSPWGKQSGAHINPSVTLTFLRLGKVKSWDAFYYVVFQFAGGLLGALVAAFALAAWVSHPSVNYVVTAPGHAGTFIAFIAEIVITFILMSVILHVSNAQKFHKLTGLCAGILVATYITFEAPISGMSMNPARTLASAVQAHHWTALWIYFAATLSNGKVFVDMTRAPGEDAIDGIKVDQKGNLYVCGPGGIWVLSSEGKHLGTIKAPKNPHNIAWGGPDGKTLYIAAQNTLYRMPLNIPGIRPGDIQALAAQR